MTLRAIKPLLAAWGPYGNLSIDDMFAEIDMMNAASTWLEDDTLPTTSRRRSGRHCDRTPAGRSEALSRPPSGPT